MLSLTNAIIDVYFKCLQIAVIDTDDPCSGAYRHLNLFFVMRLHQCRKSKTVAQCDPLPKGLLVQKRTNQKHGTRSDYLRLIDHIFIHGKILPKQRNIYFFMNFFQIFGASHKIIRFCQYRNAVSTYFFVFRRNVKIRKMFCDHAFGWRRFFYFADKGNTVLFQLLFKRKPRLRRQRKCLFFHLFRTDVLFAPRYPLSCLCCDLI